MFEKQLVDAIVGFETMKHNVHFFADRMIKKMFKKIEIDNVKI